MIVKHDEADLMPRKITVEEMMEFLDGNEISPNCPMCRDGVSTIHIDEGAKTVSQLVYNFASIEPGRVAIRSRPLLATILLCGNCGYVRTFAAVMVNQWLNRAYPERMQKV